MSDLAPVALFVYNRVEHTRKTISALQKNVLAAETNLIIFSDASKNITDQLCVNAVREYIKNISGFSDVTIIYRDSNYGLSRSISDGVTQVINEHNKVIVLEDDLIPHDYFLTYMNDALNYYKDNPKVMNVNAYVLPSINNNGEVFFTRLPTSWGWGTWRDRWQYYNRDPLQSIKNFNTKDQHHFDFDSEFPFFRTILRNGKGELNTWSIFWYETVFKRRGLCVSPPVSLIYNSGNDGSGVNSKTTQDFHVELQNVSSIVYVDSVAESKEVFENMKAFYRSTHNGLLTKIYMFLLRSYRTFVITFTK
jgi:hypothetical protein